MSTLFDSKVYDRRRQTPWARMNVVAFMRDMMTNREPDSQVTSALGVILTCRYRHDVASRTWWTIEWTTVDGGRCRAEAQELDLCLWRAAETELDAEEKYRANRKDKDEVGW